MTINLSKLELQGETLDNADTERFLVQIQKKIYCMMTKTVEWNAMEMIVSLTIEIIDAMSSLKV